MVCGDALRSPRCRIKSATALSTVVLVRLFAVPTFMFAIASSRLRPRMMLLIYRPEPVERQMRVNLGCRNVRMAQDSLHCPKVGAVLHHVRGAGMAQHVWRRRAPGNGRGGAHHLPNALARQLAPTPRDKQQG